MEITAKTILPFQFYTYKQPFTGSCQGMRYRIVRQEEQPEKAEAEAAEGTEAKPVPYFLASVWKEPYAYEHTPPEEIENKRFSFDEEGYQQVLAWLNEKKGEYE